MQVARRWIGLTASPCCTEGGPAAFDGHLREARGSSRSTPTPKTTRRRGEARV
ncbi:hypothetical protein ACFPRL_06160 [Pseudoclavibacter helvolus]